VAHPQIAVFARLAKENTPPVRALEGQKTRISRTMHGFAYDAIHDEIVVSSPLTQSILIFRGGASGEEAPVRIIQGPHTQILGTAEGGNDKVSVDAVNNEILLPVGTGTSRVNRTPVADNGVLVFARDANGDVAPKRILSGADTQIRSVAAVAADPLHDRLIVNSGNALLIFNRTASGNTKPLAVIQGPKSGVANISSFQVYPEKGWIIGAGSDGSICAWSVNDNGDIPPKWRIPVQKLTGYVASGIALDPVHKEIILSAAGQRVRPPSGIMNTVITFSWPEIFE
jgi:WD40 repeat protein